MKLIITLFALLSALSLNGQGLKAQDEFVYFNEVTNPSTIEEIKAHLIAQDIVDGDLTDDIYVKRDNYTGFENVLGDFVITFGVTDSIGQETTVSIIVRNLDTTVPNITVDNEIPSRIEHNGDFNFDDYYITAYDEYDGDLTHKIEIDGEIDVSKIGEQEIHLSVSDRFGNTTEKTITIFVADTNKPVFNAPLQIFKNSEYILSPEFFLDYITAYDETDGDLTSNIQVVENNFVGNADDTGRYEVILKVHDSSYNVTSHTLIIEVADNMIPLLIIDDETFVLSTDYQLSNNDFVNILKRFNLVENLTYIFNSEIDNYSNNYNEENNDLRKRFELVSSTGLIYEFDLNIDTVEYEHEHIQANPSLANQSFGFIKTWWWLGIIIGLAVIGVFKR